MKKMVLILEDDFDLAEGLELSLQSEAAGAVCLAGHPF